MVSEITSAFAHLAPLPDDCQFRVDDFGSSCCSTFVRSNFGESEDLVTITVEQGHRFGGAWTELKLDAVHYYLGFFTTVLRTMPFELWYIDAFAGSGSRVETREIGGLLDGTPFGTSSEQMAGSVMRALSVDPPFGRHVFIEGNASRFRELEALLGEYPAKRIECRHGDANTELRSILSNPPWFGSVQERSKLRAVVFLDPYGMNVAWDTLRRCCQSNRNSSPIGAAVALGVRAQLMRVLSV